MGPGQVLLIYTLSLSTDYPSGPISGAGETVDKTGLCRLGEVAQGEVIMRKPMVILSVTIVFIVRR